MRKTPQTSPGPANPFRGPREVNLSPRRDRLLRRSANECPVRFSDTAAPIGITLYAASLLFLLFLLFSTPAHAEIRYQVSLSHPDQHLFHVSMEIPDVHGELTLQMPAWNALYQIRDFS